MSERRRTPVRAAVLVTTAAVVVVVPLTLLGVPSPVLFAAVAAGMGHALTSPTPLAVPGWAFRMAQGLVGITVGALVDLATLRRLVGEAPAVVSVVLGTLAISLVAGLLLARRRDVSATTGVFALLAGGASGVVAVARDLGADDRVVTVVQYLRVLVVLLSLPLVTGLVFQPPHSPGRVTASGHSLPVDLVFVALSLVVGLALARLVPVTTMTLLGPLLVSSVIAAGGWLGPVSVPEPVGWLAFALIGVQVGLRFTRASLSSIARMLPAVVGLILGVILATAGLGVLLSALTPADPLTAYLATTPGGLFAVLVIATDSGAEVTYVMAVQLLRLLVILAVLPLLARWLRRVDRGGPADPG